MFDTLIYIFAFSYIIYWIFRRIIESFKIGNLSEKPVLITGCDSGFGHDLALKCILKGMPVFAACLTPQGKDQLEAEVQKITRDARLLTAFLLEVTSEVSMQKAKTFVENEIKNRGFNGLHALVNNAGIVGNCCWDDWLRPEDYETVWRINTLGVIRATHAFKNLIKKAKGRIINTASVCGRVSLPGIGPYSVSKYGVECYTDTLRLEMLQFGVRVCLLEPGFFKTPLTNSERQTKMMKSLWDRLGEETREEYGEKFYQYTIKTTQKNLSASSDRTELVVDAYFHAITSVLPRQRYQIGNDCIFGFIPFSVMPTQIQDWAFALFAIVDKLPKPQKLISN